jgi:ABC-type amino acid transport substrate-binding protein
VVSGSLSQRWLDGSLDLVDAAGGPSMPPPIASIATAETDDECLAALLDGRVEAWAASAPTIAAVLDDGAGIVAGAPAAWAPVAAAVDPSAQGFETLLAAVDAAITQLRDDGTLSQLSERALGMDVSSPPVDVPPEDVPPAEPAPEEEATDG